MSVHPSPRTYLVNGRFLGRPVTGVERFARETLRALDEALPQTMPHAELLVAVPPGVPDALPLRHGRVVQVGRRQGHAWEQMELARFRPDLPLLNLCNTAPVRRAGQLVVIHDAAVFALPQAYSWRFRTAYRVLHRLLAHSTTRILTVSGFSRNELAHHLSLPRERIGLLPPGGDHMLRVTPDDAVLDRHGLRQRPYVLAVSSNHLGKNFALLAQAMLRLEDPTFDVVIAGGMNSTVFSRAEHTGPAYIKRVGYVSDGELSSLYRHAAAFVFPSVYEGFGMPPLEAMTLGCPVVSSHAASMPEVCGDAAVYFDPHDPDACLKALDQVMGSGPAGRQALRARSLARSKEWRWQGAALALAHHLKDMA